MIQTMKIILPSVLCENIIPNIKFQNNWQTHNLRGRIKEITDHIKREIRPDTYYEFKECLQFDTQGNVVEVKAWNAQQQFMKWHTFRYDKNGNYIGKASLDE